MKVTAKVVATPLLARRRDVVLGKSVSSFQPGHGYRGLGVEDAMMALGAADLIQDCAPITTTRLR